MFNRPRARLLVFNLLAAALFLASAAFAQAQPKSATACEAYFTFFRSGDPYAQPMVDLKDSPSNFRVFQRADANVIVGLDPRQADWYRENHDKKEFAHICLWKMDRNLEDIVGTNNPFFSSDGQQVFAEEFLRRMDNLKLPVYVFAWVETTRTVGTGTRGRRKGLRRYVFRYHDTDGVLARWDTASHALVGIERQKKVHSGPASVDVLRDALKAIEKDLETNSL